MENDYSYELELKEQMEYIKKWIEQKEIKKKNRKQKVDKIKSFWKRLWKGR